MNPSTLPPQTIATTLADDAATDDIPQKLGTSITNAELISNWKVSRTACLVSCTCAPTSSEQFGSAPHYFNDTQVHIRDHHSIPCDYYSGR